MDMSLRVGLYQNVSMVRVVVKQCQETKMVGAVAKPDGRVRAQPEERVQQ